MKKTAFTVHLVMLCFLLSAQQRDITNEYGRLTKDTLYLNSGATFGIGQKIKLGYGSTSNKDFEFIHLSPWSMAGPLKLGSAWANQTMVVKEFKSYTHKKTGTKIYIVLKGGNLSPYWCDVVAAIDQKEIVVDGVNKNVPPAGATVSLADELKKLKDLFDSGAITKEEYDAAKKKLLGNYP